MLRVGLTGTVGSGKSTVLAMFGRCGAAVASADDLVHQRFDNDVRLNRQLKHALGSGIFEKGKLSRGRLAELVFSDNRSLQILTRLVHPLVRRDVGSFLKKSRSRVAVVEVPLLFEAGWQDLFDVTAVVVASASLVRQRFLRTGGHDPWKRYQRRARLQMTQKQKAKRGDFIIDNSADRRATFSQVRCLMDVFDG